MKDLRGIYEENVMPKRIFVDKFLQHSHLLELLDGHVGFVVMEKC